MAAPIVARGTFYHKDGTSSEFLQCDIIFTLYVSSHLLYGVVISSELAAEDGKVLNRRGSQSDFDGGSKRARVDESALENDMEAEDSAGALVLSLL